MQDFIYDLYLEVDFLVINWAHIQLEYNAFKKQQQFYSFTSNMQYVRVAMLHIFIDTWYCQTSYFCQCNGYIMASCYDPNLHIPDF